ncbi:hypothetical protein G9464_13065 [Halostella sp. JP-L12]|uniref:hypothetical protein n=1 Tax=Halostella TaxID=1843185 RepID=UPI000EF80067|nr:MULTISPECIES: hypothetical protein [Halostella]NHN48516.1 hypothetical protein [Halostella sp. JP-L12]
MDPKSSKRQVLFLGFLSIAVAGLTVALTDIMGKWPTEFGPWGAAFFLVIGVVLVGQYAGAYTTEDETAVSDAD